MTPSNSIRTMIIEVFELDPPITANEYSHEAITTVGAEQQYFYGHSTQDVLAKILSEHLKKRR